MKELTVMGAVSSIFDWMLQCINAGLMNVIFKVGVNETTNLPTYKFEFSQERLISFLKGVALMNGKDLPLEVLRSFPPSIGGGEQGVKNATEHPNREAVLVIGPLAVAIVMLIAIIGLIIINLCTGCRDCCCCCRRHKRKQRDKPNHRRESSVSGDDDDDRAAGGSEDNERPQNASGENPRLFNNGYDGYAFYDGQESDPDYHREESLVDSDGNPKGFLENLRGLFLFYKSTVLGSRAEEHQEKIMEKMEEQIGKVSEKSEFVRKHQNCFCCTCHVVTLVLAIAYVAGLIVCIVIYIMAAQQVIGVMDSPSKDPATQKAEIVAWLNGQSTSYNLAGTVSFMLDEVVNLLDSEINTFVYNLNQTLEELGPTLRPIIINGSTDVFDKLQNVTKMDKLFVDIDGIYYQFIYLQGNVSVAAALYNDTMKSILGIQATFQSAKQTIVACGGMTEQELGILDINFNPQKVAYPYGSDQITLIVNHLADIRKQLLDIQKEIQEMPTKMADELTAKLNFSTQIADIKAQVDNMLSGIRPQVEEISDKVPDYISKARPYVGPALYVPAGIMALIGMAFFTCLILFMAECCHRKLFSPSGDGPSELAETMHIRRRSHICGGWRFLCCSILLILVVLLALVAAVILALSSLLAVELCPYVYNDTGIHQSDYVLNSIIAGQWPPIEDDMLDMPQPTNVLYALNVQCNPTNGSDPKLLPTIGVTKLANLTKLAEKNDLDAQMDKIIRDMAESISKQIPEDVISQIEQIKTSVQFLEKLIEYYNAEEAVTELQKLLDLDLKALNDLFNKVSANTNCTNAAETLKQGIDKLTSALDNIKALQGAYKGIAAASQLPQYLNKFSDSALKILQDFKDSATLETTLNIHIKPLVTQLMYTILNDGTKTANGLVDKVLPCGNIHYILNALVSTGCSVSGLVPRLFGWALALILTALFAFLAFVGLFNLWCIQSHQIKRFYG